MSDVLLPRLIAELPELGGWPEWAYECVLHTGSKKAMFYDEDGRFSHQPKFPQIEFDKESDVAVSVSREAYEAALAASKPEWDGDGLPTVGCESQIILGKNGDLGVCEVLFIGSDIIVWRQKSTFAEGSSFLRNVRFLPIRSEEKKRDEVANGLIEYLDKETDIDNVFSIKDVIGFYDAIAAGKIPHIRID
ncbi:hypothetical protein [Enterobacter cloacae]|uniref:hypothetical protein n=1 Tax=Enterobacter cloacae TaxID=550 RepID=UPI00292F71AA|nr:hypothetical protein [Enterobacter cloacae]